ncbi:alpha-amylase family glycosyl hydrolase [Sodalis glossinidius]|nr:alpha-amylase family glycosyl hydrolase [Sodalis glossinidius]
MEAITRLLRKIYPATLSQGQLDTIKGQISFTKSTPHQARKAHWDEDDVVLITYADQFMEAEKPTLDTFTTFFNHRLRNTFSLVHLLPFYPYSSDYGFSVIDYQQVNPIVGSWQQIGELNLTTRLMFDFICNHMSAESRWVKGYLAGQQAYDDFFIALPPATASVTRPRTSPLLTPFTAQDGSTRYLWTTLSADQVDLNFNNPQVLIAVIGVLLHYLIQEADYIRLDAVGYLWKEVGTRCLHLPHTHLLVKLFRAICDEVAPGTVIITETNVPHKDNISYFGNGRDKAQMVYQFPLPPLVLHALHNSSRRALRHWAAGLEIGSGATTLFFNFLASHDGIEMNPLLGILPEAEIIRLVSDLESESALVSYKQNTDGTTSPYEINVTYLDAFNRREDSDETRLGRFILAHAILLEFPGVPAIYVQSILGSRNDYEEVKAAGHNRAVNREKYPLKTIEAMLDDETSLRSRVFQALSALIRLRRRQQAFHPDAAMEVLEWDNTLLAFYRAAGQRLLCLFNLANKTVSCTLPDGDYRLLTAEGTVSGGPLTLAPYSFYWLETLSDR